MRTLVGTSRPSRDKRDSSISICTKRKQKIETDIQLSSTSSSGSGITSRGTLSSRRRDVYGRNGANFFCFGHDCDQSVEPQDIRCAP